MGGRKGRRITGFSDFTDEELDVMEEAFCNEGLKRFVDEIRKERRYRESRKAESEAVEIAEEI